MDKNISKSMGYKVLVMTLRTYGTRKSFWHNHALRPDNQGEFERNASPSSSL
jgi:hypothetical protein